MTTLEGAAVTSVCWSLAALAWTAARAWRRPHARASAAPAGRATTGILYAFGPGMSPRVKESASHHPLVYAAGVAFHLGVAAGGLLLAGTLSAANVPGAVGMALGVMMGLAVVAGAGLLVRRARTPLLRAISSPDDYASNLLVVAWLLAGVVAVVTASPTMFLVATIALACYAPLGKIRHCVFFVLARGLYGARLGRRGIVTSAWHGSRP